MQKIGDGFSSFCPSRNVNLSVKRGRSVSGTIIVLALALLPAVSVTAAPLTDIQVIAHSVESHFPDDLTFTIQVRSDVGEIVNATLHYQVGWNDVEVVGHPEPFVPATEVTFTHIWDTSSETVPPFIEVTYYWEVVNSDGSVFTTAQVHAEYADATHDWRSLGSEQVIVYWYDQPDGFGRALFEAAAEGYDHVASVTGVTTEPAARVVIYNNQRDFCAFYAPYSCRDWIGGQTFSGITVQWGTDQEWLTYDVVPHELAHVFYNEVFGDTWVRVPTWFNEGIAVYNERTDHAREMNSVKAAAANGELIPLRHMGTQASGLAHNDVGFWYAEAYSLVAFIADVHGERKLGQVILTLADNHPMEETLQQVLGQDLIEFEIAWREWLGYPVDTIPTPMMLAPVTITPFPTIARGQLAATPTPGAVASATEAPPPMLSPVSKTPSPFGRGCVSASVVSLVTLVWVLVRSL